MKVPQKRPDNDHGAMRRVLLRCRMGRSCGIPASRFGCRRLRVRWTVLVRPVEIPHCSTLPTCSARRDRWGAPGATLAATQQGPPEAAAFVPSHADVRPRSHFQSPQAGRLMRRKSFLRRTARSHVPETGRRRAVVQMRLPCTAQSARLRQNRAGSRHPVQCTGTHAPAHIRHTAARNYRRSTLTADAVCRCSRWRGSRRACWHCLDAWCGRACIALLKHHALISFAGVGVSLAREYVLMYFMRVLTDRLITAVTTTTLLLLRVSRCYIWDHRRRPSKSITIPKPPKPRRVRKK